MYQACAIYWRHTSKIFIGHFSFNYWVSSLVIVGKMCENLPFIKSSICFIIPLTEGQDKKHEDKNYLWHGEERFHSVGTSR